MGEIARGGILSAEDKPKMDIDWKYNNYKIKFRFSRILRRTDKALLLEIEGKNYWKPLKKLFLVNPRDRTAFLPRWLTKDLPESCIMDFKKKKE